MAETVNDYNETDLGNVAPNPRGDYSETGEYEYLDLVAYAGGSYMCILAEGTVTGTAPTPGKTTEIWQEASRPGNLTPEYVALHDDVVNKAASVAEDAASVASDREQVEGMKENVASLQEQTAQDTQLTKKFRESAAGYASAAETSRMAAGESEENIRALVNGFDAHVEEQKTSAQEEITTSRQAAIKAIAAQQVSSVNSVKREGQNAIDKTKADAEATAADRAAVSEMAATVDGQAAQVAQNAAQVAEDKATAEKYMQTAGESKKQALEAAERLKDSVDLVQKNTVDLLGKAPVIIGSVTSNDGTPVEVNDSAEMQLQGLRLYGKSKQVVTTGKNLSSIKSCQLSTNVVKSKIVSWTKKNRIYVSCDTENIENSNAYIGANYYDKNREIIGENGAIIPCDGTRKEVIFSGSEAGPNSTNIDLTTVEHISVKVGLSSSAVPTSFVDNIMLCDEAKQPYEPYTGGKPSPSPEYPQEIVSVGQKLSTGKNLINADDYYSAYKQADGTYVSSLGVINKIKVGLGAFVRKQITISIKVTKPSTITYLVIAAMINNTRVTSEQEWGNGVVKITVTPVLSTDYFWMSYGSGSGEISISDIQVEYGSEATDYEPYTGGVPTLYQKGIEVRVTGKNLLNFEEFLKTRNVICTKESESYQITNIGQSYSNPYKFSDEDIEVTISCIIDNITSKQARIEALDSSKKFIASTYLKDFVKCKASYIRLNHTEGGIYNVQKVQIERGVTATAYEPYHEPQSLSISTPTGLPAIPVPSGTSGITYNDADGQAWIADEIDFARGKYIQRVWNGVLDGSEDERWSAYSGGNGWMCSNGLPENMSGRKGFCNEKKVGIVSEDKVQFGGRPITSSYIFYPNSKYFDTSLSDYGLSNWKAHLAERPLKVMTYLDTPIEADLSEEQVQAYKLLTTFKPTSVISNDANAQMEVEYAADTKAYIDNKLQEIAQALVASASEAE